MSSFATFVTTKSLNIDAIPCKIAIGSLPLFTSLLQIFKIEAGSLLVSDLANSINSSSGTAPIKLIIFNCVIGGGSKLI